MTPAIRRRTLRWLGYGAGALVLAAVFASWLRPDMMFAVLSQAWSCL